MGLANYAKPLERQKIISDIEPVNPSKKSLTEPAFLRRLFATPPRKAEARSANGQKDLPRAGAPRKFSDNDADRTYRRTRRDSTLHYSQLSANFGCEDEPPAAA
jgi:hypothetical protein